MKKTIKDLKLNGKKVLLRVDFNVPMDENGNITDDNRIMEELNTINYLIDQNAKIIICSHLGRPKGEVNLKYSLKPVAERLAKLVKAPVYFATDTVGRDAKKKVANLKDGEIVVLENLRFQKEEEANDPKFAKKLADLADIYVNDAFGTAHRKHASTYGVAQLLPNAVGFLMGKEVKVITELLKDPKRPFVAILGGAKIEDKIPVIENLIKICDTILIGGGMAFTFIKAQGGEIGDSLLDKEHIELAKSLIEQAKKRKVNFVLPTDCLCNITYSNEGKCKRFKADQIPQGYMGLDIGKNTIKTFKKYIKSAKTVVWNGPVGVSEFSKFEKGTRAIAKAMAKSKAFTFIGGGDSAAAVIKMGYSNRISHISTGGGASLNMLEGKILPGVEVIANKRK